MNVVLAHGFFGFNEFGTLEYFNGVKEHLDATFRDLPIRVFVPQVDPIGRVEERGPELSERISEEFSGAFGHGERIHIIAHSMGGLDARYCISSPNGDAIGNQVASLTTIGTPHLGSPVADAITGNGEASEFLQSLGGLPWPLRDWVSEIDLETGGIQDLTKGGADALNAKYPNIRGVRYFSVAGTGRAGLIPTSGALFIPHQFISLFTGKVNDGLVDTDSATWGESCDEWPTDHADEIGHDLNHVPNAAPAFFDHLSAYEDIVRRRKTLEARPPG